MKLPDFIFTDMPLTRHSTLGVGGPADYFTTIKNVEPDSSGSSDYYLKKVNSAFYSRICEACTFARNEGLDIFVLGRGSNVLFSDRGFRGLVMYMDLRKLYFRDDEFWSDAGALVSDVVSLGTDRGFSGYECFAGLPGTVGGAIYGNAGCYGGQFWDVVQKVMFFDGEYFQTWEARPDMFGYRWSVFQDNPAWIIVAASLKFEPRDGAIVGMETKRIRDLRQASQPKQKSAGCIFRNPPGGQGAGQLIDEAGLKGMIMGQAEISRAHANFFINNGGATAGDFIELIKVAKSRVLEKFGILLQEEIKMIREF